MDKNLFNLANACANVQSTFQKQLLIINQLQNNDIDTAIKTLYNRENFDKFLNKTYIFDAGNTPNFIKDLVSAIAAQYFVHHLVGEFKQLSITCKSEFVNSVEQYLENSLNLQNVSSDVNNSVNELTDEQAMQMIKTAVDNFDAYDELYLKSNEKIIEHASDIKAWFHQHVLVNDLPTGESEFSIVY